MKRGQVRAAQSCPWWRLERAGAGGSWRVLACWEQGCECLKWAQACFDVSWSQWVPGAVPEEAGGREESGTPSKG